MKISLLGYMGAGKTSVAKEIASQTGLKLIDLDSFIETETAKTIPEIFAEEKELGFRKQERKALLKLMESAEEFVLSLGGGTPVYYDNMALINAHSESVYLRMTPAEIVERVKPEKKHRPLLAHLDDSNLPEFIAKHLFDRRPYYEQAKLQIDAGGKTTKELASEIIRLLRRS